MPLLNTSAIMDEIGFSPRKRGRNEVNEILSENGLSLEETIIELKNVMDNTTDQHLKSKILDIILGMHGVKSDKNTAPSTPNITFIFNSSPSASPSQYNAPFILPSESIEVISEKEK